MSVPPTRLDELIEQASRNLQDAAGGVALCAITRSGGSAPAVKYYEGQWAALSEVRRATDAPGSSGVAVRDRWTGDLALLSERGADANWIAYANGGVDALTDYLSD